MSHLMSDTYFPGNDLWQRSGKKAENAPGHTKGETALLVTRTKLQGEKKEEVRGENWHIVPISAVSSDSVLPHGYILLDFSSIIIYHKYSYFHWISYIVWQPARPLTLNCYSKPCCCLSFTAEKKKAQRASKVQRMIKTRSIWIKPPYFLPTYCLLQFSTLDICIFFHIKNVKEPVRGKMSYTVGGGVNCIGAPKCF